MGFDLYGNQNVVIPTQVDDVEAPKSKGDEGVEFEAFQSEFTGLERLTATIEGGRIASGGMEPSALDHVIEWLVEGTVEEASKELKDHIAQDGHTKEHQNELRKRQVERLYGKGASEGETSQYQRAVQQLHSIDTSDQMIVYLKEQFPEVAEQHSALETAQGELGIEIEAKRQALSEKKSKLTALEGRTDPGVIGLRSALSKKVDELQEELAAAETRQRILQEAIQKVVSETTKERLEDGYAAVRSAAEALHKREAQADTDYKAPGTLANLVLDRLLPLAGNPKGTFDALRQDLMTPPGVTSLTPPTVERSVEVFKKNVDVVMEIVGGEIPSTRDSVAIVALRSTVRTAQELGTVYGFSRKVVEDTDRLSQQGKDDQQGAEEASATAVHSRN